MANFLSCSGTVQALLDLYNKVFAQEVAGHKKALVALKDKVLTSTVDAKTAATNTFDTLSQQKQNTLNKFDKSFNEYVLSLKDAIKVASNAIFDQDQENSYTTLSSSQEINDDAKKLQGTFSNLYVKGINFIAHDLADVLDNPYAVNTEVSSETPTATPVSLGSCFAVKGSVKKELEAQKATMKQNFATELSDAQTGAKSFFTNINGTMIQNTKNKVSFDKEACSGSLKDLTHKIVDHFAAAIANSPVDDSNVFLNNTGINTIVQSFEQSTCDTLRSEVLGDVNSGLDAVANGVQFDA